MSRKTEKDDDPGEADDNVDDPLEDVDLTPET
jgi:hypothetical protein